MATVERYYVVSSDEFKVFNECSKNVHPKSEVPIKGGWRESIYSRNHMGSMCPSHISQDYDFGVLKPRLSPIQEEDVPSTIFNALPPEFHISSHFILQILGQLPGFYINPHDFSIGINGKSISNSNIIEILYGLIDRKLSPYFIPGCKLCLLVLSRMEEKLSYRFISNPKAIRIILKYKMDNLKRKNKK